MDTTKPSFFSYFLSPGELASKLAGANAPLVIDVRQQEPFYYLQGGINAWRTEGLPLAGKPPGSGTRWVTRERPKIDRSACPWLIRRFVDADDAVRARMSNTTGSLRA